MPHGYRTLDGNRPNYAVEYGMKEHKSPLYPPRTKQNVLDSDGTVRFAVHWNSSGELCTLNAIERAGKPHFKVEVIGSTQPSELVNWIKENNIKILNVAGNSEKTVKGIEEFVIAFLAGTFTILGFKRERRIDSGTRADNVKNNAAFPPP